MLSIYVYLFLFDCVLRHIGNISSITGKKGQEERGDIYIYKLIFFAKFIKVNPIKVTLDV